MKYIHHLIKKLEFSFITIGSMLSILLIVSYSTSYAFEFEYEGLPFYECVPVFSAVTDKLILHKELSSQSPLAEPVNIKKGSLFSSPYWVQQFSSHIKDLGIKDKKLINYDITLNKSIVRIIKPGLIKAVGNGNFQGSVRGENINKTFYYSAGDVIEYLAYYGEGECTIRFKGEIIFNNRDFRGSKNMNTTLIWTSDPVMEWWVNFTKDDKSIGWLKVDKNGKNNDQLKFTCAWWG